MENKIDIVGVLRHLALEVEDNPVEDIERALLEAARTIVVLRNLIGLQERIVLEDAIPLGCA